MKEKIKQNRLLFTIIMMAVFVFGMMFWYVMSHNETVKAVVLVQDIESGTVITEEMVKTVEVPASTPAGFLQEEKSVIGGKLKTSVKKDQLLYESNFMTSWTEYIESEEVPEDYVITSISVPDDRACGGVITAGDYIDIMLVSAYTEGSFSSNSSTNTEINGTGRSDTGTSVAYVLSNVLVLSTNSSLSQAQESDVSVLQDGSNDSGNYYIIALCYDDCKKLRQAEGVDGQLWLNICPRQNLDNPPLLKQMVGNSYSFLHDAQEQVQDKDGKMLTNEYYTPSGEIFTRDSEVEITDENAEETEIDANTEAEAEETTNKKSN